MSANAVQPLFLYAVYLEDGGVERRAATREEVPQVGDRFWAHGREWLIQRRTRTPDGISDYELDAILVAHAA